MTFDRSHDQTRAAAHPTSPWMQPYPRASREQAKACAFDGGSQRPCEMDDAIRDALSRINTRRHE